MFLMEAARGVSPFHIINSFLSKRCAVVRGMQGLL